MVKLLLKQISNMFKFSINGLNISAKSLLILTIPIIVSCEFVERKRSFKEGIIEYEITYNDSVPSKVDPSLRPDKMVIKYKDKNVMNRIEGFSGAISITFIRNETQNLNITLIKLLNKKLYYEEPMGEGEFNVAFNEMPRVVVQKTDENVDFLGYKCKKAIAYFADSSATSFEILYIDNVSIDKPNQHTPFETIEGVMLKFSVKLYDQEMYITAVNVKHGDVSNDEFSVPSDYEKITKETVYDVISLFQ